jgi:glycerol-3-phosphate acyltransferase PlsX
MATAVTKAGAMLAKPAFRSIRKRLDYTEYGGAPLLGVSRIVVIGHGRSNARAIRNAIRSVKEFSEHHTAEQIENAIQNPQITQMPGEVNLRASV